MNKKQIKSIFTEIITQVYESKCPVQCKEIISSKIKDSKIKDSDKQIIFNNLEQINTLVAIQKYATNSMFQYEGLGLLK